MFFFHEMMLVLNTVWVRIILLMGWRNKVWAHQHTFCCSCFRAFCLSSIHTFLTYCLDELEWTTLSFDNPIWIYYYVNRFKNILQIILISDWIYFRYYILQPIRWNIWINLFSMSIVMYTYNILYMASFSLQQNLCY